jgi:hypothetical protein
MHLTRVQLKGRKKLSSLQLRLKSISHGFQSLHASHSSAGGAGLRTKLRTPSSKAWSAPGRSHKGASIQLRLEGLDQVRFGPDDLLSTGTIAL